MRITRLEEAQIVMSDERMTGRRLYASEAATLIHITLYPGQEIAPHATEVDMEFFVISGHGRFTIGSESADAGPGMLVESPATIPHGIANPGPSPLELLAIKNGKGHVS